MISLWKKSTLSHWKFFAQSLAFSFSRKEENILKVFFRPFNVLQLYSERVNVARIFKVEQLILPHFTFLQFNELRINFCVLLKRFHKKHNFFEIGIFVSCVVYLDQHLGAANSKRLSKPAFLQTCYAKMMKNELKMSLFEFILFI